MLDRKTFDKIISLLEKEQRNFPSFISEGAHYIKPLLQLWFDRLREKNCTNAEFEQVYDRVYYHMHRCSCHIIPNEETVFSNTIKMIDLADDEEKKGFADSIIKDLNNDSYRWFREFGGTKSYAVYSHFYHHLIAIRNGKDISYCPFSNNY